MKCIKLAICLLVVLFSVCACSTQESILEEAESTMPETTQTESMETIDSMDVLKEDLVKRLALCITDNNAPDGRTNVNKRFDQYVQTGFLSVRMGPTFETDASDRWFLTKKAKEKLKAAEEHGLTIKLVPQTVSSNPSYLSADADTHMVIRMAFRLTVIASAIGMMEQRNILRKHCGHSSWLFRKLVAWMM